MPFLLRTLTALALLAAGCLPAPLFPTPADAPPAVPVVAPDAAGAIGSNVRVVADAGGFYEASIALSRTDPRRMVIGVIGPLASSLRTNYVFTSTDGAQTWTPGAQMRLDATNEKIYSRYGDPVIAADRHGRFYHAGLILQGEPGKYKLSGIGVSHSDDGIAWSQPVIVTEIDKADSAAFDDKEWLAVDDTDGPFGGSVYLLWQKMERLPSAPGVVYFARSRDRGLTWETPVALTSLAMSGTCLIDVGPQGEIHIAYYRDPEGMVSRVSWDGGDTFGAPVKMLPEGLFGGAVEGTGIQFPGFPHLIVDRSRSAHRGNAYFVHVARGRRADGTVG
ncbi:MAG TPA: sialidase family protein, partial [Thermoanaerobaculia bacterium]|nr:sialidase family protein [Thermoanaerobaculia bacterium]